MKAPNLVIGFAKHSDVPMLCEHCGSSNGKEFGTEMNIHLPCPMSLDEPGIFVFPKLAICLDCGFARGLLREDEVRLIHERLAIRTQTQKKKNADAA